MYILTNIYPIDNLPILVYTYIGIYGGFKMKLLIVGSRSIKNYDLSEFIPPDVDVIISGGAEGIDSIAEQYADKKHISKYIIRPQYSVYGKTAPLKRNEIMVDMADFVLVIWDGKSKGAKFTIKYAKKCNKPVSVILV